MSGRHTGPIPVGNDGLTEFQRYRLAQQSRTPIPVPSLELPNTDPHGYFRLYRIGCATLLIGALTALILHKIGVLP